MAARRERERRRPSAERRYSFGPEPKLSADEALLELEGASDESLDAEAVAEPAAEPTRTPRASRSVVGPASTRGGSRPAPRPFNDFKAEYAYVYADLRRVAAVVGSLLLILIVLYFVLPH